MGSKKTSFLSDSKKRFIFFSLTPIMILFFIFSFLPIIFGIGLSFYNYNPLNAASPFVGLKNYIELFKDPIFYKSLKNTFVFVTAAVSINLIVSTLVALGINSIVNKFFQNFFRTVFFLPAISPIVAAAIIWRAMFNPMYGTLNNILSVFGVDTATYWLSDPKLVLPAIILMTLWQDIGYNIVLVMAGLQGIPKTFIEAAEIDGASNFVIFFKITLPLLTRTIVFVSIMTILSYFQIFAQVQIMSFGGPDYASEVISLHIYDNAFRFMRMGYASAESVILLIIMFVISFIQIKLIKADWEY